MKKEIPFKPEKKRIPAWKQMFLVLSFFGMQIAEILIFGVYFNLNFYILILIYANSVFLYSYLAQRWLHPRKDNPKPIVI